VNADLIELTQELGGQRVLLVGDLMLDRYIYGDAERVSPEAPVPVLRAVDEQQRVGGAGSVAANLQALGVDVLCCGMVGEDRAGEQLLTMLRDSGANCDGIIQSHDRPTTTKTRLVGLAQHRHRQQLLRLDQEDASPISVELTAQLLEAIGRLVPSVQIICIEDYNKGLIDSALVRHIVDIAAKYACPVLVDPASIGDFGRYRGTALLTPNRNELAAALGRKFDDLDSMGHAAAELARSLEVQHLVVTVDREGALLAGADGQVVHVPTRPRAVYDNTGAGDAVLAMIAAAIAAGATPHQAVQMANVAGGLEVEKFGCVPITRDEVLADLRIEHRRKVGKLRIVDELVSELQLRRDRGETVGFTNGCFDLVHRGHVEMLQRCADHADILVVGLNSDASVQRQDKGSDRPFVGQEDRAAVLAALECVDYVVIFDDPTPESLIRTFHPDVLMKGADWAGRGVVGREFVEAHGGRVELIQLRQGYSTTALVERIRRGQKEGNPQ
jgi:D-beta-D-heptose 7-phosphate kinase/D-beta-D-heptose 1-phosphate adenosyltransferase